VHHPAKAGALRRIDQRPGTLGVDREELARAARRMNDSGGVKERGSFCAGDERVHRRGVGEVALHELHAPAQGPQCRDVSARQDEASYAATANRCGQRGDLRKTMDESFNEARPQPAGGAGDERERRVHERSDSLK
jgi:hypothetical protein